MKGFLPSLRNLDAGWIWRTSMFLLTVGLYWLQSNFIPRSEYTREREQATKQYQDDKRLWADQMQKLNSALQNLDTSFRIFEANKAVILDHESRLRALERKPVP